MNTPFNNSVLRNWFFKDIELPEGMPVYVVTNVSGPFDENEFDQFLKDIGLSCSSPRASINMIVLGQDNWRAEDIDLQIELRRDKELFVYSQEMLLSFISSGMDPYEDENLLLTFCEGHSALEYIRDSAFDWPVTSIVPPSIQLSPPSPLPLPQEGLLKHLGYQVGKDGIRINRRREILRKVFEDKIPEVNSSEYMESWGKPKSSKRLKKLADSLATFSRNAQMKKSADFKQAIQDWEDDLFWLKKTYYHGKFTFKWPS